MPDTVPTGFISPTLHVNVVPSLVNTTVQIRCVIGTVSVREPSAPVTRPARSGSSKIVTRCDASSESTNFSATVTVGGLTVNAFVWPVCRRRS